MLQKPSEQEIEKYLSDMDNSFFQILADIEELPSFSLFNKSRVTQKLYLILHAVEIKAKTSDATLASKVEAINDHHDYNAVKESIRDYCIKCSNDVAIQSTSSQEESLAHQAGSEKSLATPNTTSSRFFAAPPISEKEEPEQLYNNALLLAYELCESGTVDAMASLKTESNTKELTSILNLMIWRIQGMLDDEVAYSEQVDGLVAALFVKANNSLEQPDVFKLVIPQHWFIPFAVLLLSVAVIPAIWAILEHISPQNQDGFHP